MESKIISLETNISRRDSENNGGVNIAPGFDDETVPGSEDQITVPD